MSGQEARRQDISAISQAVQCQVTTAAVHGYSTGNLVRFTDLTTYYKYDSVTKPRTRTKRGMHPVNNNRYEIVVDSTTTFLLKDPISHDWIDSTDYPVYVDGGYCNFIATEFEYEE